MSRRAVRSRDRKRAQAQADLEKAVARAEELGVEMRPLPSGVTGSVRGAVRALVGSSESWGIAHQLLQGAMDPDNPRQLDYISRLKEWIDGLETTKSETSSVQKRVVLNLGGGAVVPEVRLEDRLAALEEENRRLRALLPSTCTGEQNFSEMTPAAPRIQLTLPDVVPPRGGGTAAP